MSPPEIRPGDGVGGLIYDWCTDDDVKLGPEGVIPIGYHADGIEYTTSMRPGGGRSCLVASFNILSPSVEQRSKRYLFAVIAKHALCKCGCNGYHTYQALHAVFSWSMQLLRGERAPNMGHDGVAFSKKQLKQRLRPGTQLQVACLVQVRGDREWYGAGFRFRAPTSQYCCYLCDATLDQCYDTTDTGPHRTARKSHVRFLTECARDMLQVSTLFRCPGLKLWHFTVDAMHTMDLGPLLDILGSILYMEQMWRPVYPNMATALKATVK